MLDNDEIARRIAERLYPEEALKARLAAFEKASRAVCDAVESCSGWVTSDLDDAVDALNALLED